MLTETTALRAYAAMMNTLDVSRLEPLLADDFQYASQLVLDEIDSKASYLTYIRAKLDAVRASGHKVWAEMGELDVMFPGPCVVLSQGTRENIGALVLARIKGEKLIRLDLCVTPPATSARRTGEYPR